MSKYDIVGQSDGNHKYINWDFVSSLNMNGAGIEANLDEELCSSSFSCALEQLCQSDKVLLPKTWDIVYNKSNKSDDLHLKIVHLKTGQNVEIKPSHWLCNHCLDFCLRLIQGQNKWKVIISLSSSLDRAENCQGPAWDNQINVILTWIWSCKKYFWVAQQSFRYGLK